MPELGYFVVQVDLTYYEVYFFEIYSIKTTKIEGIFDIIILLG
jgi:hypothetical protein